MVDYLDVKFFHVLVAIAGLGSSAGLGVALELYGDDPKHGAFLLRVIQRLELIVVLPGFALMLATGVWMVILTWSFATPWIQAGIALWLAGILALAAYLAILHRQIRAAINEGVATARYRRLSLAGRGVGALVGLSIAVTVWIMVTKPALSWWPFGR